MMIIFRLAWRNLWRHPRRTGLTMAAIAFAAFLLVFMITLQLGSYDMMIDGTLRVFTGHFQAQRQGYQDRPQMRLTLSEPQQIAARLRAVPRVSAVAVRAMGFALISSKNRTYSAQVIGVESEQEGRLSTVPGLIKKGRFFQDDQAAEIILGAAFARNLQVEVGNEITLLGSGWDGSIAAAVLPIVGIFESGAPEMDRGLVEIPLGAFQEIFSMENKAHTVVGILDNLGNLEKRLPDLRAALPVSATEERVLHDWNTLVPGLQQLIQGDMVSSWVMYFCLIVVVVFSILNTFFMAVLERTREFGILLALGIKPLHLMGLVMLESLFLIALGLNIGIAGGAAVAVYYHATGFSYPGLAEIAAHFGLPAEIYPQMSVVAFSVGPLVILGFTLLAALYPALRIRRLQPVEAMKAI